MPRLSAAGRSVALRLAAAAGLPRLAPLFWHRSLVVLMYHYFRGDDEAPDDLAVRRRDFRDQMAYLADHFRVVRLSEALRAVLGGTPLDGPAVCVTVDDVGTDFERHAWPVLEDLSIPATVAVCPGLLGTDLGDDAVFGIAQLLLRNAPEAADRLRRAVGRPDLTYERAWELLRGREEPRLRAALEDLGVFPNPGERLPGYVRFPLLGFDALRAMTRTGLLEVASHTMTHPALGGVAGDWLHWEVAASRRRILDEVGSCAVFVYPGGQRTARPDDGESVVRAAGYDYAFHGATDFVTAGQDPFALGRITVVGHEGPAAFRARASGLLVLARRRRRAAR